jgi:rare lipoprotein A
MDGNTRFDAAKALRTLAIAAALVLPASASAPALADDKTAVFAANFADIAVPQAHTPTAGAVDISTIDPADELAETAEPGLGDPIGSGVASYYADKFNGRRTASGETFHNGGYTAAHRSLPFGSKVRVTNPANGKSVVVRINDRGPFHGGRVIDLTKSAASTLGIVQRGHGRVELALVN